MTANSSRTPTILATAATAATLGGLIIAHAGPLDPPPGPPQPTGRTLGEIYDRIDLSLQNADTVLVDQGPWQSFAGELPVSSPTVIDPGSGILHSVILSGAQGRINVSLEEIGTGRALARIRQYEDAPTQITLNVRYETGLRLRELDGSNNGETYTILFRSDAP